MLTYFLFVLGFVLLIKGADYLVKGASSIAKRFNVSDLVIGLTIVAFGTSMPEFIVNVLASLNGSAGLAIGNVLGSNIANILLILGISAAIYPLSVQKNTTWKEIPFSFLASLALLFVVNDNILSNQENNFISRGDGLVLILFFIIFLYYTFLIAKNTDEKENLSSTEEITKIPVWQSVVFVIGGITGLMLGGQWIVDGAIKIASSLGLSETIIGLTVVAVGTSLPELATSALAAFKKETDIAIGNVVGSNIFNILWILGASAVINPIPFNNDSNFDVLVVLFTTILLFAYLFVGKKHALERWQGYSFVILYILYTTYLVFQELN